MKDYVYIQSNRSIMVTGGLQSENVTNKDAHVADRLKVNPLWPKLRIMIKSGRHIYPSLITEWATVKALVKDGIITIGEETDSDDEALAATAADLKAETKIAVAKSSKKVKDITLDEVAD